MQRAALPIAFFVAVTACLALACKTSQPEATAIPSASTRAQPQASAAAGAFPELAHARTVLARAESFASRAEAVALADQLALAAANKPQAMQQEAALVVADIRRRAYRAFHAINDAREAIEQYTVAARGSGATTCQASLHAAVLRHELGNSPSDAYAELYRLAQQAKDDTCERRLREALQALEGFRPEPSRLAAVDEALKAETVELKGDAPANGPVVTPNQELKPGPAKIASIDAFGSRDAARVVIQLTGPVIYEVGQAAADDNQGWRLYVDLPDTTRGKAPRTKQVGGLVQQLRLGQHHKKTRVVLDLREQAYRRVFFLPDPFRIIVDVTTKPPAAAGKAAPAQQGARRIGRIALDAGHGGIDPGAVGPGGLREKDVTLDIAHRLAPILSRELGITTMLTRDDDSYVSLEERTARANAFHADLFVSVHCNASEFPDRRGVQSYVLDVGRDELAQRVAARENASPVLDAHLGLVLRQLRVEEISGASLHFAKLLQTATLASLSERYRDTPDGGVRSAGFYVLLGAEMPSVLFEASYISNPVEESRLATADYRQKLADGIANAIRAYVQGR